jgi:hypothetical protein
LRNIEGIKPAWLRPIFILGNILRITKRKMPPLCLFALIKPELPRPITFVTIIETQIVMSMRISALLLLALALVSVDARITSRRKEDVTTATLKTPLPPGTNYSPAVSSYANRSAHSKRDHFSNPCRRSNADEFCFLSSFFQVNRTGYMTITELGVNVTTNSAYFSWEIVGADSK